MPSRTSSLVYQKEKTSVVATGFAPYDFARQIAGDDAEVTMLLSPGEESHTFEPTAADIMKIRQCDVFVYAIDMERKQWIRMESQFINRRILITKPELNGKHLGDLKLRKLYGINITRINRAGVDLVAKPNLTLQVGDRVNVVGTEASIANVEKVLGNSLKRSVGVYCARP